MGTSVWRRVDHTPRRGAACAGGEMIRRVELSRRAHSGLGGSIREASDGEASEARLGAPRAAHAAAEGAAPHVERLRARVEKNEKRGLISGIWGKPGAAYWEKGVCRRFKKQQKKELISDIWGKRGAAYGEKGVCRRIQMEPGPHGPSSWRRTVAHLV